MSIIGVDGNLLRKMIISGANELTNQRQEIDALNVFPVPDGDTGTNMSLTVQAAAREVEKLSTPNIYDVAKAASGGSLRGARGNSGVIVSQLFRGFAKGLEGKAVANGDDLAYALVMGMETAYKAVMKPKEGTILTIARVIGEKAMESAFHTQDIEMILREVLAHAWEALNKTTQMLPALRQAGVVDAGGKGLLYIFEGAQRGIHADAGITVKASDASTDEEGPRAANAAAASGQEIKFAYCTEFFINVEKVTERMEDKLKRFLSSVGDSIVVVGDEDIIKVHVHTNHPGSVLERAMELGELSSLKIENMKLQHTSLINFVAESAPASPPVPQEKKETGFVAVSMGDGLRKLFLDIGADVVIEGGQSMNPSTEDILSAIEKVHAHNVVVLPNNKNIVLTAEQAAALAKDKKVSVLPTLSIPQGISSLINYVPTTDIGESLQMMREELKNIISGQITYAVRDTVLDGKEIKEGDIICLLNGSIIIVQKDLQAGAEALIDEMLKNDGETVSIYYGQDVTQEMAEALGHYVTEKYPDHEIEVYEGGQPLYYYILSLE